MSKSIKIAVLAELRDAEQAVRYGKPDAVIVHLEAALAIMRRKEAT